jgi:hypothetical protein
MTSVKSLKLQLQGFKGISTLKKSQLQFLVNLKKNKQSKLIIKNIHSTNKTNK